MNARQWLICGLIVTVISHDVADALSHIVFAKKLIEIQKPVVAARMKARYETRALLRAKVADSAGKGLAAAAFMKKKALAVAAAPLIIGKAIKAKLLAKKLGLAATPLLLKELKKGKKGKHHGGFAFGVEEHQAPAPVNVVYQPQYAAVGPVEEVVVPHEEFAYVDEGKGPIHVGFVENALENLGNAVPILHPITDRMSKPFAYIRNALSAAAPASVAVGPPETAYQFLPELPPHYVPKYTHIETQVPTGELGLVDVQHEIHEVPPPQHAQQQEVQHGGHVEVPHETYGIPQDLPQNQSFDQFRPVSGYGAPGEH